MLSITTELHQFIRHPNLGFETFLNTLFGIGEQIDDEFKSRQVQRYLRAMIDVEFPTPSGEGMTIVDASVCSTAAEQPQEPAASSIVPDGGALHDADNMGIKQPHSPANNPDTADELKGRPRPRIIYLKDFGAIASHARSFLRGLILAVRSRRTALQSSIDSGESHDAHNIQPTVIVLGVSHSPLHSPHNSCQSDTWSDFVDGFKDSDHESICMLCPEITQGHISSDTESITNVLSDVLCTTPRRVRDADTTYENPDMGPGAIYRRIIGVHGFFDRRDPLAKFKKGGRSERKPDQTLWIKGEAMAQKERKDELAPLHTARDERRFAANEKLVCKAIADYGVKIRESLGIFSALPEGNLTTTNGTGSDKSMKPEELETEKYATLSGLKSNNLPEALANQIAALALYELRSPNPATAMSEVSRTPFGGSASSVSSSPSTRIEERIVSPGDVAAAIAAAISGKHQLDQWLDNYEKATKDKSGPEKNKEDPIVAKVRSSPELNEYEERLLGCVIDTSGLSTQPSLPIVF